jgi:ATP:ADP antiporter, AAA family
MSRLLERFLDIRRGERLSTTTMVANYFLVLVSIYLLRPARDALFLINLEPAQLPWVYLLTALIAAPVAVVYARVGRRFPLQRVSVLTIVFLMTSLWGLYRILEFDRDWVYYLFYAWSGVVGGLVTSQFWLLANAVYDASQAKRVFPVLGIGGIAGAFVGGELTNRLVEFLDMSAAHLVLISMLVLGLSGFLGWLILRLKPLEGEQQPREEPQGPDSRRTCDPLRSLTRSRHLMLTIGIISLTVMTGAFVDFQFMSVSWAAYPDEAELTSFLGLFYGRMSLLSLAVQLFFASRLIRRLGVGGVLVLLPVFLGLGTVGLFLVPGLAAGMILRGGEITFKYSLDQTSRELLFLPIPLALKRRTKVFMDVLVHRLARGLAGVMLLVCTGVLGLGARQLTIVTGVLILLWILLALLMRREYVDSFRKALSRREINPEDLKIRIDDASSVGILSASLDSKVNREVIYALKMLRGVSAPGLADRLRPLLQHESPSARQLALEVLADNGGSEDGPAAKILLGDADLEVRVAALVFLARHGSSPEPPRQFLAQMLAGETRCRNAALAYVARHAEAEEFEGLIGRKVVDDVMGDTEDTGVEGRVILARLASLPTDCSTELWDDLLADTDRRVVHAAIDGVARRGDTDRAEWLLNELSGTRWRVDARRALIRLARQDDDVFDLLEVAFTAADGNSRQNTEITRILAGVPEQKSVDLLLRHLAGHQPLLRFDVLKALGKLRSRSQELRFPDAEVSKEIIIEANRFLHLARLGQTITGKTEVRSLVVRAIGEMRQMRLESVFRLMGLLYPSADLVKAYRGLGSNQRPVRANAREFLDSLLVGPHRKVGRLLADFQDAGMPSESRLIEAGLSSGPIFSDAQEALEFFGASCDPWLAACAIFAGARSDNPATVGYLHRTGEDMLNTIEKALVLQKVEFFAEIPTDQLGMLAGIARQISVLSGDILFEEGDETDAFYLVLDGCVSQHRRGREVVRSGPLDPLAGLEFFNEKPCFATATALEDSSILKIDRDEFNDLLADDVRLFKGILHTLVGYLQEMWDNGTEFKIPKRKPFHD